jgi:hypothetical protein
MKPSLAIAIIAVASFLSSQYPAHPAERTLTDSGKADAQPGDNARDEQELTDKGASVLLERERQPPQRTRAPKAEDINQKIADYTAELALFTKILAVVTAFLAIPAFLQAAISRNASRRQLRAYVFVSNGEMRNLPRAGMDIQMQNAMTERAIRPGPTAEIAIENSGQTPAYDVTLTPSICIGGYPRPTRLTGQRVEYASKVVLPPHTKISVPVILRGMSLNEVDTFMHGETAVYVHGKIVYRDAFHRHYATDFRFMAIYRTEGTDLAPCDDGNSEKRLTLWSTILDRLRASVPGEEYEQQTANRRQD